MIPVSYTFLSAEENCPHKAYRQYVTRDLPRTPQTPEQANGTAVHKALERRINEGTPLPDGYKVYEPCVTAILDHRNDDVQVRAEESYALDRNEKPIENHWSDKVLIRTRIDVVLISGRMSKAHIFDWKTGKMREDPFELKIQAWLLQRQHPELKEISGNYIWLKDMKLGVLHDLSDTERTANSVRAQLAEIERRGNVWPKRPNPLCRYCPVLDCEHNRSNQSVVR